AQPCYAVPSDHIARRGHARPRGRVSSALAVNTTRPEEGAAFRIVRTDDGDALARSVLSTADGHHPPVARSNRSGESLTSCEIESILPEEVPPSCIRTGVSEKRCTREDQTAQRRGKSEEPDHASPLPVLGCTSTTEPANPQSR